MMDIDVAFEHEFQVVGFEIKILYNPYKFESYYIPKTNTGKSTLSIFLISYHSH